MAREPVVHAPSSALHSDLAAAELRYQQSISNWHVLGKDEDSRRLRTQNLILRHDLDKANQRIWEESARGMEADVGAEQWQTRAEKSSAALEQVSNELRIKTRELKSASTELAALHDVSTDSQKLLTEKLALSRELDLLKPELDHLRSTTKSNKGLLTEKLALERELGNMKIQLESERDQIRQLRDRENRSSAQDAQQGAEVENLRREVSKAQRELARAGKKSDAEESKRLKELEKQLAKETRAREAAEQKIDQLEHDTIEGLRRELASERERNLDTAERDDSQRDGEIIELRKQLSAEKHQLANVTKVLDQAREEWDADKNLLDDKLEQFRTKLRSTKEKLKQAEADLQQARSAAASAPASAPPSPPAPVEAEPEEAQSPVSAEMQPKRAKSKPSIAPRRTSTAVARPSIMPRRTSILPTKPATVARKRSAPEMDPDAAIGTPGDMPAVKKARTPTAVGSKSTFSITPFLNKTSNLMSDTPEPDAADEPVASVEDVPSPSLTRTKEASGKTKPAALAQASPGKSNPKVASAKRKHPLEKTALSSAQYEESDTAPEPVKKLVTEAEPSKENRVRQAISKPLLKARKSLSAFASFREGSLPPQQIQQKKKRKLGGAAVGTLFDDDDNDEGEIGAPARALASKRAFGGGLGRANLGLRGKSKGPLTAGEGGFMFSPLKKDRRTSQMPAV